MSEVWDLPEEQPAPSRPGLLVLLGLCLSVLGVVAFFLFRGDSPPPSRPRGAPLLAEERQQLEQVKEEALRHLSSNRFDPADRIFSELAWRLPDEPLGLRNLAICRLLALESGQVDPQIALETANQLVDVESESPAAHWLAARVYGHLAGSAEPASADEFRRGALAYLRRAADLEPSDRHIQFALYESSRSFPDSENEAESQEALETAFRLDPRNLFVLLFRLRELAAIQDRRVAHVLQGARTLLVPFRRGILARRGRDPFELIDRAAQGALAGQWDLVESETCQICDLLAAEEVVDSDRRLTQPHPMEYLIHRFSDDFYAQLPPPVAARKSLPRFRRFPSELQPPLLSELRDLVLTDLDRDGRLDLVVLQTGKIVIFSRQASAACWSQILQKPVPEELTRLIALRPLGHSGPRAARGTEVEAPPRTAKASGPALARGFFLYGEGGTLVLRAESDARNGSVTLAAVAQGDALLELPGIRAATAADLAGDGRLYLALATRREISLWGDRGKLVFENVSEDSSLPSEGLRFGQITSCDWERDGDLDLLALGSDYDAVGVMENLGHGSLRWQSLKRIVTSLPTRSRSAAVSDLDGNGSWDILVAGELGLHVAATTTCSGAVIALETRQLADDECQLMDVGDLDGDGRTDVLVEAGGRLLVYHGADSGGCGLTPLHLEGLTTIGPCRLADMDADGDLDLVAVTCEGVVLYANQTAACP